jgi:hypothetical protein
MARERQSFVTSADLLPVLLANGSALISKLTLLPCWTL